LKRNPSMIVSTLMDWRSRFVISIVPALWPRAGT
jgi:hypothetical protein